VACGRAGPNAVENAMGYATFYSRSNDAVIRVYDDAVNVIETHKHNGDFKDFLKNRAITAKRTQSR
jgi:hypothetical protein